jgi:LmbE family N-acetylglucosaminyl deacetylase
MPETDRAFVVGPGHLGTSEDDWAGSAGLAGAPDLTLASWTRVVVVAPHPDDEVLGAGGLLQVLAATGASIEVVAVTDGEGAYGQLAAADSRRLGRTRSDESLAALRRLGLRDASRQRLGHPDGAVDAGDLTAVLADRTGPGTLCVAPWRHDGHPDHERSGEAAVAAAASSGADVVEYLVWAWHWAAAGSEDIPWAQARRLALCPDQQARKRWATAAFRSQTVAPPGADSPVLPPAVLRRFWRPFEVFLT